MVKLTDDEKRIHQGEKGHVLQACMQYIVDMAEIAGAERLVDLDGTGDMHTPGISPSQQYQITLDELREFADNGGQFKIPTFADKSPVPFSPVHGWEKCTFCRSGGDKLISDPEYHKAMSFEEEYKVLRKMGLITTHSCANYLTMSYLPSVGQHCSWFESSQMPYCNATLGARTNFDGSIATCLLGKAAYYDMHITENRLGTILVETDRLIQTDMEFDVYGFAVGEAVTVSVPVVTGTSRPTTTQYEKFNSAASTGGAVRMYHMPGITPEAPTIEHATGGKPFKRKIMIDDKVLKGVYDSLNFRKGDTVDLAYLGCPHLNIVDLMILARKLDGKKCKVPLWIMTTPWLYEPAREHGYLEILEKAGALVLTGTCIAALGGLPNGISRVAVDSAKQSSYVTGVYPDDDNRLEVCYGTQDDCIDAALTGVWHGEWR